MSNSNEATAPSNTHHLYLDFPCLSELPLSKNSLCINKIWIEFSQQKLVIDFLPKTNQSSYWIYSAVSFGFLASPCLIMRQLCQIPSTPPTWCRMSCPNHTRCQILTSPSALGRYGMRRRNGIDHFIVVGLVTWSLNGSEAGVDPHCFYYANQF